MIRFVKRLSVFRKANMEENFIRLSLMLKSERILEEIDEFIKELKERGI